MNKNYLLLPLFLGLLCIVSCNKEIQKREQQSVPLKESTNSEIIPLNQALETLDRFLEENYGPKTKAGKIRKIASISTYYSEFAVKSSDGDSVNIPNAYLVNFENEEGFAVLGANTNTPNIVAVTESGAINDDLTVVLRNNPRDDSSQDIAEDSYLDDDEDIPIAVQSDTINFYCSEDDDFYAQTSSNDEHANLVQTFILCGLNGDPGDGREDGDLVLTPGEDGVWPGWGGSNNPDDGKYALATVDPILKVNWGQRGPYNKYCKYRLLWLGPKIQAKTGCSTTALAMIMSANEFPKNMTVKGTTLDWSIMKAHHSAKFLTVQGTEHVALLMHNIYSNVRKIATPWFTLITPEQIKKRMKKYGYTDVTKHSSSKFTSRMIRSTSNMLSEGKPVFLSAIPRNFTKGHSWVVDGAKFSSEDQNNYLLHFNFGWGGGCNGYFSTDCLNPAKGEEYDYPSTWNDDVRAKNNYTYSWHFRLITYNIPTN